MHNHDVRDMVLSMSDEDPQSYRPTTPLMEAGLLYDDAEAYRWTKELLKAGEDPNTLDLMYREYPIYVAWREGRTELVKLLLDHGAKPGLIQDQPFEITSDFLHLSTDVTKLLLDHGLKLSREYQQADNGERISGSNLLTDLLLASQHEKIEAFIPYGIMEFIDVFALDDGGDSPLGRIIDKGTREDAQWLLDQGANIDAHSEYFIGYTPLDRAVQNHDVTMVKFLLDRAANPNIPTWMWQTSVDEAIKMDGRSLRHWPLDKPPNEFTAQVYQLIIDASTKFPPPLYPDGTTPDVWPPEHKSK